MQQIREQNCLSIVVVLGHGHEKIDDFLRIIGQFCQQKFISYEFIFVDNGAGKNIIDQLMAQLTNSSVQANLVSLPYEVNKEQAILVGVDAAIGDYVFEFEDTDIDYLADDLWSMYQNCLTGNDIVLLKPNYKIGLMERVFYKFLAKFSNKNNIIYPSRVHLISRRAINRVNNINKIIYYRKYAYCNSGLNYIFIDYKSSKLINCKKLNWQQFDFATDLFIMFTDLGKRVAIILSLLFILLSIFAITYTIITYITMEVIHGWTTTMLLISTSFTGVFLCFAVVIKYLNLLLINQQQDKSFISSMKRI